jgi:hypothetical protein
MNPNDALSAIAASLTAVKGRATLDHLPSLRIKTRVLNEKLVQARAELQALHQRLDEYFKRDEIASEWARTPNQPLFYFRAIVPRMIQNFLIVLEQLLSETQPPPQMTIDELKDGFKGPGFREFNSLTTATRQLIDTVVVDAYQFTALDPRELVYQIMTSLVSFVTVAPASLQVPIVTPELQAVATEFSGLSGRQARDSAISRAAKPTFSQKAEYLCEQLKPDYHRNVLGNLNTVFSFCSEFTHVGYVPTLIVSNDAGGIILGGPQDAYVPSSENFAKLKHQLLRECAIFFTEIYIPSVKRMASALLTEGTEQREAHTSVDKIKADVRLALNETNYEFKVQPIARGLKTAGLPIHLPCNCGGKCIWTSPYFEWFAYCDQCGARFETMEVSPMNLYALSAQGIGDVVGAAGPELEQLTAEQRSRLTQIWKNVKGRLKVDSDELEFVFVGNPDAYDDEGKNTSGTVLRVPKNRSFQICAWVTETAMKSQKTIDIQCNCGATHKFEPPYDVESIHCSACGISIGIYVISGDPGYITAGNKIEGKIDWRLFPVFGSIYETPQELSSEQRSLILQEFAERKQSQS